MSCRIPQRLGVILCLCGLCGGFIFAAQAAAGVWLDVPFIKQEKEGCGAASIAMVMQYWQKQLGQELAGSDPVAIQQELYSPQAHGIHASDMERYFQQNGLQTFTFAGTWDDLKQHVEKGRPLIA